MRVFDKQYVVANVNDRIAELRKRYFMYCNGANEVGAVLSESGARVARSIARRDIEVLQFIAELLGHTGNFELTEEAGKGYEKLVEPNERHRINRR